MKASCVSDMDREGPPACVHPLSPVSSHSDLSLDDLDLSVKPLPPPPTYSLPRTPSHNGDAELPPLQVAHGRPDGLDPLDGDDLDPGSFDLVMPADNGSSKGTYALEQRAELLFSSRHLQAIFDDPAHLYRFSHFLYQHRPGSVPLLTYYLEALKALRAIEYSNAVLRKLEPLSSFDFTHEYFQARPTSNLELQAKADTAFEVLVREDLPMYITHVWIQTVTVSIRHRIRGTSSHSSEGLAEVFCLTDPSRPDNPIVFMSEEFNRTTQYGVDYVIGRNCRFLQGPHSNPLAVSRVRQKLEAGVEHYETLLNYRRDGSPFMNLVMLAPLYDSRGVVRYFIGAQVDVSGLARDLYGLGALKRLVDDDTQGESNASQTPPSPVRDEFTQLAEILGPREIETVRDHGGGMHRAPTQPDPESSHHKRGVSSKSSSDQNGDGAHQSAAAKHRVVLRDPESPSEANHAHGPPSPAAPISVQHNGRLTGVYENYLVVRPYPSLRILFTSPSMRMPGILQSPLLDRIGGSARMRDQLVHALAEGQGVTAKVKWLSVSHKVATYGSRPPRKKMQYNHPLEAHLNMDDDTDTLGEPEVAGRSRWLHCTPLIGSNGKVGVWMVVIVDDEQESKTVSGRPGPVVYPDNHRPHTAGFESVVAPEDRSDNSERNGDMPGGRLRLRMRRSSETLGSAPPTAPPSKDQDPSVTKSIHHQHAATSTRAPKPGPRSTSVPARFFNPAALSRASLASTASNGTSAYGLDGGHQPRDKYKGGSHPRVEVRSETPLPAWPLPPDASAYTRRKREHQIYVPPAIQETSPDLGASRAQYDDAESGSTRSRGSAFTVRIEEE